MSLYDLYIVRREHGDSQPKIVYADGVGVLLTVSEPPADDKEALRIFIGGLTRRIEALNGQAWGPNGDAHSISRLEPD